jgi:hypothetical protein
VGEEAEARQDAFVRSPSERGGDVRRDDTGGDVLRRLLLRQLQLRRPHRLRQGTRLFPFAARPTFSSVPAACPALARSQTRLVLSP